MDWLAGAASHGLRSGLANMVATRSSNNAAPGCQRTSRLLPGADAALTTRFTTGSRLFFDAYFVGSASVLAIIAAARKPSLVWDLSP